MPKTVEKTILPFISHSPESTAFSDEAERATAFCFAELNREKGRGFFRKKESERLAFISKVGYPFWLAPVMGMTLLLDGLKTTSHEIHYPALPNLKPIKEKLDKPQIAPENYADFLTSHQTYFQTSTDEQIPVQNLLSDIEFAMEFLNFTEEATTTNSPANDIVLAPPTLDKEAVKDMMQNFEQKWLKLEQEIADLKEIINLLNTRTQEAKAALRQQIEVAEINFVHKVEEGKKALEKKIDQIKALHAKQIKKANTKYEQKIKDWRNQVFAAEKKKTLLNSKIEFAQAEMKKAGIKDNDAAKQEWKDELKKLKNQSQENDAKLEELKNKPPEIEEHHKEELLQLKQGADVKIKEANEDFEGIETNHKAEIGTCQNEMKKIDELTSGIIEKIGDLVEKREATTRELRELGVRKQRTDYSLIYMPFYLSCYRSKSEKRYGFLAPLSISTNARTRIDWLFQPRSAKTASILKSFIALLDENRVFKRAISKLCRKIDILKNKKEREKLKEGLSELKEENLLSSRDFKLFNKAISNFVH